jgi:large subunit ribosomal protein L9
MALTATEKNLRIVEQKKKKLEALVAKELSSANAIKSQIDGARFDFQLRAGDKGQLFGSITSADVVNAIKTRFNIVIERRKVDMPHLKTLGDHDVKIRIYPGVIAHLNVHIDKLVVAGEDDGLTAGEAAKAEAARIDAQIAADEAAEKAAAKQ